MIRTRPSRASGFQRAGKACQKKATSPPRARVGKMMRTILLIILILLLIGSLPPLGFAPEGWGYYPGGGLLVVILLIFLLWRA
jgi:hypothetical protein